MPEVLEGSHRFPNEELSCLERSFLRPRVIPCPGRPSGCRSPPPQAPWEEIQWVAANIAGLVREEGYRYSDVAGDLPKLGAVPHPGGADFHPP